MLLSIMPHLLPSDIQPSEPDKMAVFLYPITVCVFIPCVFTFPRYMYTGSRVLMDFIIITIMYYGLNKHLAYTFSVYNSVRSLERLCVSEYHIAVFGALFIFLAPYYLFHLQLHIVHLEHALLIPTFMDALVPLTPQL